MIKKMLLPALLLLNAGLYAQKFPKAKLDSLFDRIEANDKGMGSVSLFKGNKEIYSRSYGYADRETKQRINGTTKFRVGSVSKMFTAVLVMQLIEQGKLKLDQHLSEFFPAIPKSDRITIEHLLRHRSGLFNVTNDKDYMSWNTKPITKQEMLDKIAAFGNVFEPDERYEYSNSNYILLGYIAEGVTNIALKDLIRDRIVKKCGLKNTYYGGKIDTKANEAQSYSRGSAWELEPETDMSVPAGAGAVVSTPADLNRFLNKLFHGKLVSEKSLKQMMSIKQEYGLGMFTVPFNEKTGYGHTGGIDGFASQAFYFADGDVAYSIVSNAVDFLPNDISIAVLSACYGVDFQIPSFKSIAMSAEALQVFSGTYSSPDIPLKIDVFIENGKLMAQATGQGSFPLDPVGSNTFKFDPAGIVMEFTPESNKMVLKQSGMILQFSR